jgi:hypothetical protein
MSVELPRHSRRYGGNTFIPFSLDPQAFKDKPLDALIADILERLEKFTETRRDYYDSRRSVNSRWVFWSRGFLAVAGALAFFLTAAAAALQVTQEFAPWSRVLLIVVLLVYAMMGAVAFYDRVSDTASAYFRYVLALLSVRDLWTKLQFEVLKELEKLRKASDIATAEAKARDQILALAEAYCMDLDRITTTEVTEWRTEFQTSMGELEEIARRQRGGPQAH